MPHRQTDVRSHPFVVSGGTSSGCLLPYSDGVPNTVFSIILLNSEFGRTLAPLSEFETESLRLQVGLFRVCELRKAHMGSPGAYWPDWQSEDDRKAFVEKYTLAPQLFADR